MKKLKPISLGIVASALTACLLMPLLAVISLILLPDMTITAPVIDPAATELSLPAYTFSDGLKLGLIGSAGSPIVLLISFPILILMFHLTIGRMAERQASSTLSYYLWPGIICMMLGGSAAFILGTMAFTPAAGLGAYIACSGLGLIVGVFAGQIFRMIAQPRRHAKSSVESTDDRLT